MTHKGIPDAPRAARIVLKDFVNGKLLHCSAPPGVDQDTFHVFPPRQKTRTVNPTPQGLKAMKVSVLPTTYDLNLTTGLLLS